MQWISVNVSHSEEVMFLLMLSVYLYLNYLIYFVSFLSANYMYEKLCVGIKLILLETVS